MRTRAKTMPNCRGSHVSPHAPLLPCPPPHRPPNRLTLTLTDENNSQPPPLPHTPHHKKRKINVSEDITAFPRVSTVALFVVADVRCVRARSFLFVDGIPLPLRTPLPLPL